MTVFIIGAVNLAKHERQSRIAMAKRAMRTANPIKSSPALATGDISIQGSGRRALQQYPLTSLQEINVYKKIYQLVLAREYNGHDSDVINTRFYDTYDMGLQNITTINEFLRRFYLQSALSLNAITRVKAAPPHGSDTETLHFRKTAPSTSKLHGRWLPSGIKYRDLYGVFPNQMERTRIKNLIVLSLISTNSATLYRPINLSWR